MPDGRIPMQFVVMQLESAVAPSREPDKDVVVPNSGLGNFDHGDGMPTIGMKTDGGSDDDDDYSICSSYVGTDTLLCLVK